MMNVEHQVEIQRSRSNQPTDRNQHRYAGEHQRGGSLGVGKLPGANYAGILGSSNYASFRFSKRAANVLSPLNTRDFGLSVPRMSNTGIDASFGKSR